MKRVILPVLILAVAGIGAYFFFFKKEKTGPAPEKQKPLAIGENTSTFNQSFNILLTAYMSLKEALVAGDTTKASTSAHDLAVACDSLKVAEIQGDTTIKQTAAIYASTISGFAVGLAGEHGLKEKREQFEPIADNLWQLTRTVKYDGQKLYWNYCPMAFNNRGAYWISDERQIRNPYFGNEMLECGKVADSLDYSAKK